MKFKDGRLKRFLRGGPWHDRLVVVPQETMVFSAGGFRGRYVMGAWEDV